MKRLLILLVVLGLLMTFPGAAGAGPDCNKNPDHHLCGGGDPPDDEFKPGYPCEEGAAYDPVATDFEEVLDAANDSVCVDVDSAAGDWTYTIVTAGRVNSLWMVVKDSQPGDFCYQADLWRRDIPSEVKHWVPAAVIDACDGRIASRDYTDSADSLVFAAMYGGKGSVTISVDLP